MKHSSANVRMNPYFVTSCGRSPSPLLALKLYIGLGYLNTIVVPFR